MNEMKTISKNILGGQTKCTKSITTISKDGTRLITQKTVDRDKDGNIIAEEFSECIFPTATNEQATYHTINKAYSDGNLMLQIEVFPDGVREVTDKDGNITRITECNEWLKTEKTTGRLKETKLFYKKLSDKCAEREIHDAENDVLVQVVYDKDDTTKATIKKVHGQFSFETTVEEKNIPTAPKGELTHTEEYGNKRIETWEWLTIHGKTVQKRLFKTNEGDQGQPVLTVEYCTRHSELTSAEAKYIFVKEYGENAKTQAYEVLKGKTRNKYGLRECYTLDGRTYVIMYTKTVDTAMRTEHTKVDVLIRSYDGNIVLDEQYTTTASGETLIKQKYHIHIENEGETQYTIINREEQSLHPSPIHISEKIKNMSQKIDALRVDEELLEKII